MTYHWRRYVEVHRGRESAQQIPGTGFAIVLGEGVPVMRPKDESDPYGLNELPKEEIVTDRLTAIAERPEDIVLVARNEIYRLCVRKGGRTLNGLAGRDWSMSIPPHVDDSDVIFSALADECESLRVRITELEAARDALAADADAIHDELIRNASVSLEFAAHDLGGPHNIKRAHSLVGEALESVKRCMAIARRAALREGEER